jgi:hypothetical protein
MAASALLNSFPFANLRELWEQDCVHRFISSKAGDTVEREHVYAQMTGFLEFQAFLEDLIKQASDIQEKYAPQPEDIDDPSVHDIYGPDDLMKRIY